MMFPNKVLSLIHNGEKNVCMCISCFSDLLDFASFCWRFSAGRIVADWSYARDVAVLHELCACYHEFVIGLIFKKGLLVFKLSFDSAIAARMMIKP